MDEISKAAILASLINLGTALFKWLRSRNEYKTKLIEYEIKQLEVSERKVLQGQEQREGAQR